MKSILLIHLSDYIISFLITYETDQIISKNNICSKKTLLDGI
jgi:hypothetical protein